MSTEIVEIHHQASGTTAKIAPKLGFNCFSFCTTIAGQTIESLWADPNFIDGTQRPSRTGIPILFPFAGRIRGGMYCYNGKDYELEAADGKGNAIHGFVYTRAWRVVEQSESRVTGEFQASVDDSAILSRWPSDFRIHASYEVGAGVLHSTYAFTNTGNGPLPWGLGTHPYFRADEKCVVKVPVKSRWELTDLLPTGKVGSVANAKQLSDGLTIGSTEFDDVYTELQTVDSIFTGSVVNPKAGTQTTIRFGRPFRECVVFIPPHREAICIEPYSSAPNAFELEASGIDTGLSTLQPGESASTTVDIELAATAESGR